MPYSISFCSFYSCIFLYFFFSQLAFQLVLQIHAFTQLKRDSLKVGNGSSFVSVFSFSRIRPAHMISTLPKAKLLSSFYYTFLPMEIMASINHSVRGQ